MIKDIVEKINDKIKYSKKRLDDIKNEYVLTNELSFLQDYHSDIISVLEWLSCDLEKEAELQEEMAKALIENNSLFDVLYDNEEMFDKEILALYRKNKAILEKYYNKSRDEIK
jgi:hypothetical protein